MSRNKKLWFAAVSFLVPVILLAAGKFPYMFFYLIVLAMLVPYIRLKKSLSNLKGEIAVSARTLEVGQSFWVNYRIVNSDSGSFPYLELANLIDGFEQNSPYLYLGPGDIKEVKREIVCRRRGVYNLKSLTVRTGDPFGLFKMEKPLAEGGEVKVYPRIRHFPEVPLPTYQYVGDHTVRNAAFENYSQLAGLREWRDGDSMRRIHWKQTAKHENIIVKNYERTADADLTLFIDMHGDSYSHDQDHQLEDLAVELAASLIYYRLKENMSLAVYSDAISDSPLRGKRLRDYERIMDQMIALAPSQEGSFFSYLRTQSYFLLPNTSLYLITPSLTLLDADVLLYLKRKGFSLILFYLSLEGVEPQIEQILTRLREAGVKLHVLQIRKGVDV